MAISHQGDQGLVGWTLPLRKSQMALGKPAGGIPMDAR
jgi:hypothetical protein